MPAPASYLPGTASAASAGNEPPAIGTNPYLTLVQQIQASQEKDGKALRDMIENRQATRSVIQAIQSSDANTVSTFEKVLQQLKTSPVVSPASAPAPAAGTSAAPQTNTNAATTELRAAMRELNELSLSVRNLSSQVAAQPTSK